MDIATLRKNIPEIAETLGHMMAADALHLMEETGLTLDHSNASVSLTSRPTDGSKPVKICLTIETIGGDGEDEEPTDE